MEMQAVAERALITELAASLVGRTILSVLNTTRTGLSVLLVDSAIKAPPAAERVSLSTYLASFRSRNLVSLENERRASILPSPYFHARTINDCEMM